MGCSHEGFSVKVGVARIVDDADRPEPYAFHATISVQCDDCGAPFGWRGVAPGLSASAPRRSADGLHLRAPLLTPTELELAGPLPGLREDPPPGERLEYTLQMVDDEDQT